jgi:thiol-disulfide isomerase/thioredoxin
MFTRIGFPAPDLRVSKWVQGSSTNISKQRGKVVLIEVFQVNCPGCFIYGLPEAISIHERYKKGLAVLGLATAFEDYDKNNLENLKLLLKSGEVIGETKRALGNLGLLDGDKLPYKIPFPVAMDSLKNGTMPETFEEYQLRGTPSAIIIDKKGILRQITFGQSGNLERLIQNLLKE